MKNFSLHPNLLRLLLLAGTICFIGRCVAQDNVWTSPTSGNWQDVGSWSLGVPATNQTIWLTNAGWKAVQISAATAQNFPQSLNVNAINISSPTNTFNTLLLNFAGSGRPLTVKALTVASNSAVTMFSSALQINGPTGSGMMVGGQFNQSDSVVAGNQVNVGYIGTGVYNFNSGYFTVSQLWLGGGDNLGVFNQNGLGALNGRFRRHLHPRRRDARVEQRLLQRDNFFRQLRGISPARRSVGFGPEFVSRNLRPCRRCPSRFGHGAVAE